MWDTDWGWPSPCHLPCAFRFQWWLVPMPFGLLIFVYDELRKLGVRCCPGSESGDWSLGVGGSNVLRAAVRPLTFTLDLQIKLPQSLRPWPHLLTPLPSTLSLCFLSQAGGTRNSTIRGTAVFKSSLPLPQTGWGKTHGTVWTVTKTPERARVLA